MKRKGSLWMAAGALLLAAALCLTVSNLWEERRAGEAAALVTRQLTAQAPAAQTPALSAPETITGPESVPAPENTPAGETVPPQAPLYERYPEMEMPTAEIDSDRYIGLLNIPSLGLELPIMTDWSEQKLKLTPCRYAGSVYTDDLVIAGHNYRSHFGKLVNLTEGDEITFTDVDGNLFFYEVAARETLMPTAVEEMTSGDWDLTLFTCTFSGSNRTTLRCERVEDR